MSEDIWRDDARTDRAIELLNFGAAKRDASGAVVPAHRYSRSFPHVAYQLQDAAWGSLSEAVTITKKHDPIAKRVIVTVTIEIVMEDGTAWEQEGAVTSDEDVYSWYALATCRALLDYANDDGSPMRPDEIIAMLEARRDEVERPRFH